MLTYLDLYRRLRKIYSAIMTSLFISVVGLLILHMSMTYNDRLTFDTILLAITSPYIRKFMNRILPRLIRNNQLYLYHISFIIDEIIVPLVLTIEMLYIHYTFPTHFIIENHYLCLIVIWCPLYMLLKN